MSSYVFLLLLLACPLLMWLMMRGGHGHGGHAHAHGPDSVDDLRRRRDDLDREIAARERGSDVPEV
jgi:hypothetical protein